MPIKTIPSRVPSVRAQIRYDPDPQYDFETLATITYNPGARTVLGRVPKTAEEDAQIARWVRDGRAIGLPVWAYVHSSSTVKAALTNPFGCPWDSGRSGWVYAMTEDVLKEYGRQKMSPKLKQTVEQCMIKEVEVFDQYLNGDVYGVRILDGVEEVDAVWNVYGMEYAEQEAQLMLKHYLATHHPMAQTELPIEFA